jgi:peptidase S46-like protein
MPLLPFYISPMISRFLPLLSFLIAATALADEGMWLFNNPPLKQFKEKYQFEPSPPWLEHLQKASVASIPVAVAHSSLLTASAF